MDAVLLIGAADPRSLPSRPAIARSHPAAPALPRATEPTSPDAVAAARRTTPEALRRTLRGDLDAIVLKALRVEPERRYASAAELAADVQRYLARQPVLARPDTWAYRARRFAARHPALASSGLLLLAMAVAYLATVQRHARRLEAERDRARLESDKARQVSAFVVELFQSNDPDATGGEVPTVFELLERGEQRADALAEQPPVQAQMLNVIARMYTKLGRYDRAEPLFRRALEIQEAALGPSHPEIATALNNLSYVFIEQGRVREALPLRRRTVAIARAALGDGHRNVGFFLHNLGDVLERLDQFEEAEDAFREAVRILERTLPPEHDQLVRTRARLDALTARSARADRIPRR